MLPWFKTWRKELAHRPLIRGQAFGEALDLNKLERTQIMLLRLKDLRQGTVEG